MSNDQIVASLFLIFAAVIVLSNRWYGYRLTGSEKRWLQKHVVLMENEELRLVAAQACTRPGCKGRLLVYEIIHSYPTGNASIVYIRGRCKCGHVHEIGSRSELRKEVPDVQ